MQFTVVPLRCQWRIAKSMYFVLWFSWGFHERIAKTCLLMWRSCDVHHVTTKTKHVTLVFLRCSLRNSQNHAFCCGPLEVAMKEQQKACILLRSPCECHETIQKTCILLWSPWDVHYIIAKNMHFTVLSARCQWKTRKKHAIYCGFREMDKNMHVPVVSWRCPWKNMQNMQCTVAPLRFTLYNSPKHAF